MLSYMQLYQPKTLEEAYTLMMKNKMAPLLGGGCWLRLGTKRWPAVIDLSSLYLRYIREEEEAFHIGAMATQGEVERHPGLQALQQGVLIKAIKPILGVQFRNCATIGGSIASRFGFSDIIPALLACGAEVLLYQGGRMSLEDYLTYKEKDILVEVIIPKKDYPIAIEALRKSASDFPHLTAAVSKDEKGWHVWVGCRPGVAKSAKEAEALLNEKGLEAIKEASEMVAQELLFQTNSHASKEYRQAMTVKMVYRLLQEVATWKSI